MHGGDSNHQQQQQNNQINNHPQPQQQPRPYHIPPHNQWMAAQYHQQWLAMQQYHPAAMMYQPHYVPYYPQFQPHHQTTPFHQHQYHQHYQQQQQQQHVRRRNQSHSGGGEDGDNRTIWIGDLKEWMDEDYLRSCFEQAGEVVSVKIIRNKHTGQSERYGFIDFDSHATADKVLHSHNGTTMPNTDQQFRLNWGSFNSGDRRPEPASPGSDMSIFVGDLATDVNDDMLLDTFVSRYPSVKGAKVVVDSNSGRSKGYGFVRFGDENERSRAMTEMNGVQCSSRPMRIGAATPKKLALQQQQFPSQAVVLAGGQANGTGHQGPPENDMSNTTIFVGGLDADVTDEELKESFTSFGDIVSVKIPAGKGCGFVQFSDRSSAEEAIDKLNGTIIGKQTVRLAWGRNMGYKKFRADHYNNTQSDDSYNGRQGYNGNGYYAAGAGSNGHADYQS